MSRVYIGALGAMRARGFWVWGLGLRVQGSAAPALIWGGFRLRPWARRQSDLPSKSHGDVPRAAASVHGRLRSLVTWGGGGGCFFFTYLFYLILIIIHLLLLITSGMFFLGGEGGSFLSQGPEVRTAPP